MKIFKIVSAILVVVILSGCGITKKTLGLTRQGPDASAVKTNEPLILPPEYSVRPKKDLVENNQDGEYFED